MTISNEKYYIGIDVSKAVLDVFVLPLKKIMQFNNEMKDIRKLVKYLQSLSAVSIVMEATGGYEKALAQQLAKAALPVAVVNPRPVRDFAKALGKLAKTDKIDARVIALFAEKIAPPANVKEDEPQFTLAAYHARRRQLIEMITMEKNRLEQASQAMKKSIKRILNVLEQELQALNDTLNQLIENNPKQSQTKALLETVQGIGRIAAIGLLADLPELGTLSGKQIAALVGLAPFNRDSGTLRGRRMIWGGRAQVRAALYMPTLVAIKHNKPIKLFYERLCAAGKAKKVAIIACMRKLLIIMNAMIKNNQPWIPMTAGSS